MHVAAGSPSVLIVDDDSDIREGLEMLLESEGYGVYTAKNGRDALEQLASIPDLGLILLDLDMPVMGGREFLRTRREQGLETDRPVVIFAASNARDIDEVAGWVQKPADAAELLEVIETTLAYS